MTPICDISREIKGDKESSEINISQEIKDDKDTSEIDTQQAAGDSVCAMEVGDEKNSPNRTAVDICEDTALVETGSLSVTSIQNESGNTFDNMAVDQSIVTMDNTVMESDSLIEGVVGEKNSVHNKEYDSEGNCDIAPEGHILDAIPDKSVNYDDVIPLDDHLKTKTQDAIGNEESPKDNDSVKLKKLEPLSNCAGFKVDLTPVGQSNIMSRSTPILEDVLTGENSRILDSAVSDSSKTLISSSSPGPETMVEPILVGHSNSKSSTAMVMQNDSCDTVSSSDISNSATCKVVCVSKQLEPSSDISNIATSKVVCVSKALEPSGTKTDLVLSPGHVHFMEGKKIQKVTPSRPMPRDLETVELKIARKQYRTVVSDARFLGVSARFFIKSLLKTY